MREREDANRTREAGHLDEIQGVVANTLKLHRNGAVGFIGWLDAGCAMIYSENARDSAVPTFESEHTVRIVTSPDSAPNR